MWVPVMRVQLLRCSVGRCLYEIILTPLKRSVASHTPSANTQIRLVSMLR